MPENDDVWTVLSMLEWATTYFEENRVPNPRLSIEWLLADVLHTKRLDLYLQYDRPLTSKELNRLRPMVKRRQCHEPLQYITGYTTFLNSRIEVNPSVLIPRSETEQLTELILTDYQDDASLPLYFLDIGTGSGCIPVAVSKKMTSWHCTGVDNSEKALETARKNALLNEVTVQFLLADLFEFEYKSPIPSQQSFHVVVSNPPYILPEEKTSLEKQVLQFEPFDALFHQDPLSIYKSIGRFSSKNLTTDGRLYLECNPKLTKDIGKELSKYFAKVTILMDYDGQNRFVKAFEPR